MHQKVRKKGFRQHQKPSKNIKKHIKWCWEEAHKNPSRVALNGDFQFVASFFVENFILFRTTFI